MVDFHAVESAVCSSLGITADEYKDPFNNATQIASIKTGNVKIFCKKDNKTYKVQSLQSGDLISWIISL